MSAAVAVALVLSVSAVFAHAATAPPIFYVSPSGSDTTGTGSIGSPFATITHAVGLATAGTTIIVESGTYDEMVVITVQLTLVSQSEQPSSTIVNAVGEPVGIAVVGASAAGTVIEGLTVENANNQGIYVQQSSNVIIENNFVTHNGLNIVATLGEVKAIQLSGTSDSSVSGNTVIANYYGGIGVDDSGPTLDSWNSSAEASAGIPNPSASPGNGNTISGNLILDNKPNHCAIVFAAYNSGEGVSNNIMSNNVAVNNENGLIIAADEPNTQVVSNSVIDNTILNNGEGGVIVHSNAAGDVVTGTSIVGNVISADGYQPTLEGIIVGGEDTSPAVAVNGTTISGNSFANEAIGIIVVNGQNTLVGGNTMASTVKQGINGTVTLMKAAATTTTIAQTTTVAQTTTLAQTTTVAQTTTIPQTTTVAQTTTQVTTVAQTTTVTSSSSNLTGTALGAAGLVVALIAIGLAFAMRGRPAKAPT